VGPMSFSFLCSTAKKLQRNPLIFLCFLWYPCTLPLLFMLHLPHLYFLHLSYFLPPACILHLWLQHLHVHPFR
jgi:hypothetical protein